MFIEVIKAEYIDGYKLNIKFNNGKKGVIDLEHDLWGDVFESLKDKEKFKQFKIKFDTITWKNGADFAPEYLYSKLGD